VGVPVDDPQVAKDVSRQVELRCAGCHCALGIGQRLEHVLVDLDRVHSTARTPGIASALEKSSAQMSARGWALRSVAPQSIPSIRMSEEYSNSPLTFGTASGRAVVVPTTPGRWISPGTRSLVGANGTVVILGPPL